MTVPIAVNPWIMRRACLWSMAMGALFALFSGAARSADITDTIWRVQANSEWKAYDQSDIAVKAGSALDFSFLHEPGPAGQHGFVIINGQGRLAFADAPHKPVRFFCNSFWMPGRIPETEEELDRWAEQITRAGYNAFRPHFLDRSLMEGSNEATVFNPRQLDRWDRLSAVLKRHGLYLYLDLSSSWDMFRPALTQANNDRRNDLNVKVYFDPEARENWRRGVRRLLEHVNPYTGAALKNEPQVLVMELRNEAALQFESFFDFKLPPSDPVQSLVLERFRAWLKQRYGTTERLREAWMYTRSDGTRESCLPADRTIDTLGVFPVWDARPDAADFVTFGTEVEQRTFAWMSHFVRDEIGVRVPLLDFNNLATVSSILTRSVVPVIDNHGYFDHPTAYHMPGSKEKNQSHIEAEAETFCEMASAREAGKPFVNSEWGQPFWNKWRFEGGLIFPSYAALQGWQMLTQHADPVAFSSPETPVDPFSVSSDPALKAAERMAALLFQRGDVAPSPHLARIDLDDLAELYRRHQTGRRLPTKLTRLALVCGIAVQPPASVGSITEAPTRPDVIVSSTSGKPDGDGGAGLDTALAALRRRGALAPGNKTDPARGLFESDTGQLTLDARQRSMVVATPFSEGATLPIAGRTVTIGAVTLTGEGAPCAILVSSLTKDPLAESDRLLLVISAHALNTNMTFADPSATTLVSEGKLPVLVRITKVMVVLHNDHADRLELWALAANGARVEKIAVNADAGRATATIDTGSLKYGPTPYFEWSIP